MRKPWTSSRCYLHSSRSRFFITEINSQLKIISPLYLLIRIKFNFHIDMIDVIFDFKWPCYKCLPQLQLFKFFEFNFDVTNIISDLDNLFKSFKILGKKGFDLFFSHLNVIISVRRSESFFKFVYLSLK
jgi:hypothetical protein